MADEYDLLVIGGGINGLGIARDAAARGLRVALAERGDFGGGTTSASSRLIHGGLRYLQHFEFGLVRESLRERGILARQRPHLIRPIRLLIPNYRGRGTPPWKLRIGMGLYSALAPDGLFPPPEHLSRDAVLRRQPSLDPRDLVGGWLYPDGQLEFPERLCVELACEAAGLGASVRNHTRVERLHSERGRVVGAALRDQLSGDSLEIRARVTLNAAGPWVDAVNAQLPEPPQRLIGGTWGTHLVLPVREGGPTGPVYSPARKDGRPLFMLPWDGRLLVGTTDIPFSGDPDDLASEAWETDYLIEETNALFPDAGYAVGDVIHATVGIRPLPVSGRASGAITRRHFLVDHGKRDGIEGIGSVVGGKLTTYRSLAESAVDWVLHKLGRPAVPCATRSTPQIQQAADAGDRLTRLYGARAERIAALAAADSELVSPIVPGCAATFAEVNHAIREEFARTAEDVVIRRLMLLPAPSGALDAVRRFASTRGHTLA